MNPCPEHDRMMDYLVNTEAQYGEIKKELAEINRKMADIQTKLAIIDSHNIIDKVDKLEGAVAVATANGTSAQNWFKVTMALVMIMGALVGVKIAF
jgi:hypothetical protein